MGEFAKGRCLVRDCEITLRPEEEVRQELLRRLFALGYTRDDLRVEFKVRIASERKSIDVGVFRRDAATTTRYEQQNLLMIVECKKHGISASEFAEARKQLESYLSASLNATYGVVTDGARTIVLEKGYHRAGDVRGHWRYLELEAIPARSELEPAPKTIGAPSVDVSPESKEKAARIAELERSLARAEAERTRAERDHARIEQEQAHAAEAERRRRAADEHKRRSDDEQRRRNEEEQRQHEADARRRAEEVRAERDRAAREEGARHERELQRERELQKKRDDDETGRMWEDFMTINERLDRENPGWRQHDRRMRAIGGVVTWIVVALVVFILPGASVYATFVWVGRTAALVALVLALLFAVWAYKKLVD